LHGIFFGRGRGRRRGRGGSRVVVALPLNIFSNMVYPTPQVMKPHVIKLF
jgi:hypothetical protein